MAANGRNRPAGKRLAAVLIAALSLATASVALVHAGGATALGAALSGRDAPNPIDLLGTTPALDGCVAVPLAVGSGNAVYCHTWAGVTSADGPLQVVSVVSEGTSVLDAWTGALPQGLHWGDSIHDVTARLGQPVRITPMFGTPTFVYMFDGLPYGSLELRFSAGDRLAGINACLSR
jgi:hypothetical protein